MHIEGWACVLVMVHVQGVPTLTRLIAVYIRTLVGENEVFMPAMTWYLLINCDILFKCYRHGRVRVAKKKI